MAQPEKTKKSAAEARREGSRDASKSANSLSERNFQNIQQCLLAQHLDEIEKYFGNNQKFFNYRTFRQVEGGSTHEIVNNLRGIPSLDCFMKIKQSTLSLLQPKLRIYKVLYEGLTEQSGKKTKAAFKYPCYKEIKFSDNLNIMYPLLSFFFVNYNYNIYWDYLRIS